ncbi:MAG: hypothetical protein WC730_02245 [Patescibacteria group bacterium]|jgi:hypothetical protein
MSKTTAAIALTLAACNGDEILPTPASEVGYIEEEGEPEVGHTDLEFEADETTDTAETGDTADTDDTGLSPECSFEVVTPGNGRWNVSNELTFSLNAGTPSGQVTPGYVEVMRFNVASLHPECPAINLSMLRFWIYASDNESTEWADGKAVELKVDSSVVMTGETMFEGEWVGPTGSLVVPPGETQVVSVWVDTTGAAEGDSLRLEMEAMGGRSCSTSPPAS